MADFLAVVGFVGFAAGDARTHLGVGPGMTATQGILLAVSIVMFFYLGFAMFKPENSDMGFTWTIVTLVIALGLTWRYLGSYMAAVFDGRVHFLAWAERPGLPGVGDQPRTGAELEALRRLHGHLLRHRHGGHLPAHPDPGVAAAQPPAPRGRLPCAQLQHRGLVHDQHQLAELRRRDDHVVLLPDRCLDPGADAQPGDRHSRGHRAWCGASLGATPRRSGTSGST